MTAVYQVMDLEVFGNDIDGFEINDCRSAGKIELPEHVTHDQIIELMVEEDYLSGYAHGRCEVDIEDNWI